MRIVPAFLCLIALAGCTATDQPSAAPSQGYSGSAITYCLNRGARPGSYDFDSCYRNRPEVQSYERGGRLKSMTIISRNRSPKMSNHSYPVE